MLVNDFQQGGDTLVIGAYEYAGESVNDPLAQASKKVTPGRNLVARVLSSAWTVFGHYDGLRLSIISESFVLCRQPILSTNIF